MSHLRRRISGSLVARVVVVSFGASLLLASCSDDDPSGSPHAQETTPATSPTEAEPTATPSIQPATGLVLAPETGGISIRLPESWTSDKEQATFLVDGEAPHTKTLLPANCPGVSVT